jgi:hypothetical protein
MECVLYSTLFLTLFLPLRILRWHFSIKIGILRINDELCMKVFGILVFDKLVGILIIISKTRWYFNNLP